MNNSSYKPFDIRNICCIIGTIDQIEKKMSDKKWSTRQEGIVGFVGNKEGLLHLKVPKFNLWEKNKTKKHLQTF